MYLLKRTTTTPNTDMRITVDQPDDQDGGFLAGGSFYFAPAGQDGDQHQVSEAAAKAIMGDPGLAVHFTCTPPLDSGKAKTVPAPAQKKRPTDGAGTEG